jgi:uncharacterized OB-fold protein
MILLVLILCLLFGLAGSLIAAGKGRSAAAWFILGLVLGPFSLIVAFLPSATRLDERRAVRHGYSQEYRKCPHCGEAVRQEAHKCRHCGSPIHPLSASIVSPRYDGADAKRCSACAHLNHPRSAYCAKCGRKFS